MRWTVRNSDVKNYTNWGVLKTRTLWGQFWILPQTEPPTSVGRICGRWVCTACCSHRSPKRSQEDWRTPTPGSHTGECEVWEHSHPSLSPTLHVVPEHLSKEKVSGYIYRFQWKTLILHLLLNQISKFQLFMHMYCWKKLLVFFKINIIVYNISYIFTAF